MSKLWAATVMSQVKEVPIPAASNLFHALQEVHFCDAFQARVSDPQLRPQDAYRAVLGHVPTWVRLLFKIRGIVASMLGLRHRSAAGVQVSPDETFRVGQRVGMFSIRSIEPNELIVGDNDKHLDFRISFYRSTLNGVETVTVSTAVEIHNTLGKIYMLAIKPFHRYIVRSLLQAAVDANRLRRPVGSFGSS